MQKQKRILVDMSATLIHNGHIRLLKAASAYGSVTVALTTDSDVEKVKGYSPELNFNERKEILEAIRYVDDVVPSPWLIDDSFLDKHKMDFLVHGHDNSNPVSKDRLIILNRTDGISSTMLRMRVVEAVKQINLSKNHE